MMTVVAVDGSDIEPEICDYIIIQSGERYDVIIAADGPVENYWIRLEDLTTQDIHGVYIHMVLLNIKTKQLS